MNECDGKDRKRGRSLNVCDGKQKKAKERERKGPKRERKGKKKKRKERKGKQRCGGVRDVELVEGLPVARVAVVVGGLPVARVAVVVRVVHRIVERLLHWPGKSNIHERFTCFILDSRHVFHPAPEVAWAQNTSSQIQ